MTAYWCVNFDGDAELDHGLDCNLWLMQYQYAHGGFDFQEKNRTTINWKSACQIVPGDYLVAYLPRRFYAIGQVISPRLLSKPSGVTIHKDRVERTITEKQHKFFDGVVQYQDAAAFYEDFTDTKTKSFPAPRGGKSRQPKTWKYAQRVDVAEWKLVNDEGVPVVGLGKVV